MLDSNSTAQIKLPVVIAKPMQLSSVGCFLADLETNGLAFHFV